MAPDITGSRLVWQTGGRGRAEHASKLHGSHDLRSALKTGIKHALPRTRIPFRVASPGAYPPVTDQV